MSTYRLDILVSAKDRASNALWNVHGALRRILFIATGVLIAAAIREIAQFFTNIITGAFEAYERLERMTVSLQTLVAVELSRGQVIEETTTAIRHLTEAEILQLDKLRIQYYDLGQELQDLREDYADVVDEFGEGSIEALRVSVAIRETEAAYEDLGREVENLAMQEGSLVTITDQVRTGQLNMAEALERAVGPTAQLVEWITKLALVSPFEEEDVLKVFNMAAGFGFATQYAQDLGSEVLKLKAAQDDGVVTAQRLTLAVLDLAAAFPTVAESLPRLFKGLGDIKAHGRVLSQELRQLYNAGLTLEFLAYSMGVTTEEFMKMQEEGLDAETFLLRLVETIERDFGGAQERMLNTIYGLHIAFKELGPIMGRTFLQPTLTALVPHLRELFDLLSSPEAFDNARRRGEAFRDVLSEIATTTLTIINFFRNPIQVTIEVMKLPQLFTPGEIDRIKSDFAEMFSDIWDEFVSPDIQKAIGKKIDEVISLVGGKFKQWQDDNFGFDDPEGGAAGATAAAGGVIGAAIGIETFLKLFAPEGTLVKVLKKVGPFILGIITKIIGRIGWVGLAITGLATIWTGDWFGIRTTVTTAWEEHIKPAFIDLVGYLKVAIPEGIAEGKRWINEELIPALHNIWNELVEYVNPILQEVGRLFREEVFPAVRDVAKMIANEAVMGFSNLALKINNDVIPALLQLKEDALTVVTNYVNEHVRPALDYLDTIFGDIFKKVKQDVMPALIQLGEDVFLAGTSHVSNYADNMTKMLIPALENLGLTVGKVLLNLMPMVEHMDKLRKLFLEVFESIWIIIIEPALLGFIKLLFGEGGEGGLVGLLGSFVGFMESLADVAMRLGGGFFVNIVIPAFGRLADIVSERLVGGFGNFIDRLVELKDEYLPKVQTALIVFKLIVIDPLIAAFGFLQKAIEAVSSWLDTMKEKLDNMELPWWALPGSPPPAAYAFWDIAEAIGDANDAFDNGPLGKLFARGSRVGAMIAVPNLASAQAAAAAPTTVNMGGDTYFISAPDKETARFVAHMIAEQKRKRFDEYMGRGI